MGPNANIAVSIVKFFGSADAFTPEHRSRRAGESACHHFWKVGAASGECARGAIFAAAVGGSNNERNGDFIVNHPVFKADSRCWTWGRLLVANPRTDKPSAAVVY